MASNSFVLIPGRRDFNKIYFIILPEKHIFMADPGQPLPFEGLTPLQRDNLRQERDVDIQECHAIVQFFSQM